MSGGFFFAGGGAAQGSGACSRGIRGNCYCGLKGIIGIVGFAKLATEPSAIKVWAWFAALRDKGRIQNYSDLVVARRYDRLTIATVEDEELSG